MTIFAINGIRYTESQNGSINFVGPIRSGISQDAETMFSVSSVSGGSVNSFGITEVELIALDTENEYLNAVLLDWYYNTLFVYELTTAQGDTLEILQAIDTASGTGELFILSGDASLLPTDAQSITDLFAGASGAPIADGTIYDFLTLPGVSEMDITNNRDVVSGNDPVVGSRLVLGDEDDVVLLGEGLDIVNGGGGNDWISVGGNFPTDTTVLAPQFISGGDGDDVLKFSGDGAGFIHGNGGNDKLVGGDFADTIYGAGSLPTLEDDDTIYGHGGNDKLFGEWGNDRIYGGEGDDEINGGHGDDVMRGHGGDDTITTLSGVNKVYGGAGMDTLNLQVGKQFGLGGGGDDTINMISGQNTVWGGAGADMFVFGSLDDLNGFQTIKDFEPGLDKIDMSSLSPAINDFDDLLAVSGDKSWGVRISLEDPIALVGVTLAELSSDDFLF